jgi:hypothetical protein
VLSRDKIKEALAEFMEAILVDLEDLGERSSMMRLAIPNIK